MRTAQAGPSDALPVVVTRYTDITCPRRVWVEEPRMVVSLRLTRQPVAESAATAAVTLLADVPLQVDIHAPGFEVLEEWSQTLTLSATEDSRRVTFLLRPRRVGDTEVTLHFRQAGNHLGSVSVPVEITAQPLATAEMATSPALPIELEPGVKAPDCLLYVERDWHHGQQRLSFRLYEKGSWVADYGPLPLTGDSARFEQELHTRLSWLAEEAARGRSDGNAEREIRQIGRRLWNDLIPYELKIAYVQNHRRWRKGDFMLVSNEPHIPWELVWPSAPGRYLGGPWCLHLGFSRWLSRRNDGGGMRGPRGLLRWSTWAGLVAVDDLEHAPEEQSLLRATMQSLAGRDLSPPEPTPEAVRHLLGQEYNWLHATCHGRQDGTNQTVGLKLDRWLLHVDEFLNPKADRTLTESRPGFFFNICSGSRAGWAQTGLDGWAPRLLGGGAGFFLAPLWAVSDRQALSFARSFYAGMAAGLTAAQGVRQARLAARRQGDPTWLAYALYAHPGARLQQVTS
jgi:hypothetical protein